MSLTEKQARFVEEYLVSLNASQAALRSGYSAKTAYSQGQRLLKNAEVQARIEEAQREAAKRLEITKERVLREYARIAFSDLRNVLTWGPDGIALRDSGEVDADIAATVAEITQTITKDGGTIRVKLHSKTAALDKLAEHLGLFKDVGQDDFMDTARDMHDALLEMQALTGGAKAPYPVEKAMAK